MNSTFWIWSHLSFVLLGASILSLLVKCQSKFSSVLLCLLIPGLLGILPVGQTDVSGFALAHMGTFSASMLVLLAFQSLANAGCVEALRAPVLRDMNLFWLILGMILYPAALGLLSIDVYLPGTHHSMNWCALAVSAVAMFLRYRLLGLCLAFSVLAHLLVLHESRNLWDYLIDPWLLIAAIVSLFAGMCRSLVAKKTPRERLQSPTGGTVESHS